MKLIILSYLFDKNDKQADKEMLIFLKNYPEYELTASDQAEFIQLFNTYRTLPIGAIGAIATTNTAYPYAFKLRSTSPVPGGSYKNNGIGFSGGIDYLQYIHKKVDLSLEVLYVSNSYSFIFKKMMKTMEMLMQLKLRLICNFHLQLYINPGTSGKFQLLSVEGSILVICYHPLKLYQLYFFKQFKTYYRCKF